MSQMNGFMSRRQLLKLAGVGITAATTSSLLWNTQPAQAEVAQPDVELSPDTALARLLDGNKRFVQQKFENPHRSQARLQEVATVQHPFATLLSCADSRVPAEIVFDQGIGDLFDVRIAGNIVTPESLGSVEYAAAILGTPLIMVLGHERCGAVTAAVKGGSLPGQISTFAMAIKPAIAKVKAEGKGKLSLLKEVAGATSGEALSDLIEQAVLANIQYQVKKLKQNSDLLTQLVQEGRTENSWGTVRSGYRRNIYLNLMLNL